MYTITTVGNKCIYYYIMNDSRVHILRSAHKKLYWHQLYHTRHIERIKK